MKLQIRLLWVMCLVLLFTGCEYWMGSASLPLSADESKRLKASATPLLEGVLQAYETHQVVALGDYHWNTKVMPSINGLLSNDDLLNKVKHIVVEFGNSRHQTELNAYLKGKSNKHRIIDQVRRDALFFTAWMPDIYGTFFEHVRAFNLQVEPEQQVTVWLAEAPFYWEEIERHEQWKSAAINKTNGFVQTIERVMATRQKVLMVFGAFHLLNISDQNDKALNEPSSLPLATLIKRRYPNALYTVWPVTEMPVNEKLNGLVKPSLLSCQHPLIANTPLVDILPKARYRLSRFDHQQAVLSQLVDGLLYVGPSERLERFSQTIMADTQWLNTMERRLEIVGGRPLQKFKEVVSNSE